MNLTFKGFLRQYCCELSNLATSSLKQLCAAAASSAPRVAEPLFLLAAEEGRLSYLLKVARSTPLEEPYTQMSMLLERAGSVDALLDQEGIPERLRKVKQAYEAQRDTVKANRRIIALMRAKTVAAMRANGLTAYRICKALGLNLGNVYAYLGKGDDTKVSRDTARRIMEYVTG